MGTFTGGFTPSGPSGSGETNMLLLSVVLWSSPGQLVTWSLGHLVLDGTAHWPGESATRSPQRAKSFQFVLHSPLTRNAWLRRRGLYNYVICVDLLHFDTSALLLLQG